MRRLVAGLAALGLAAACTPPRAVPAPSAAASQNPADRPFFAPGEATPVPEGVLGTANPFFATHPATSTFTFPEQAGAAAVTADYVVGLVQPYEGGVRVSCLARGKDPRGTTMEFRFEALVPAVPTAPVTWPVKDTPAVVLGQARVNHFRGAGTGWVGRGGSVALTRVERDDRLATWGFLVEAAMEPAGSAPASPTAGPVVASATPVVASANPVTPVTTPPAAFALRQLGGEFFVRWSGTFYTLPEAGR